MKHSTLVHIALLVVAALALVASTGCYIYPPAQPTVPQMVGQMQPGMPPDQGKLGPAPMPDPGKPGMGMPLDAARPGIEQPLDASKPAIGQPPEPGKPGPIQPPDPMRPGPGQPPDFKPGLEIRPDSISPNFGQPPDPRMVGDPQHRGPTGEASVSFTASRTNLKAGECVTLNWNIQGEGAYWVELDAQRVERSGQKQVCPQQTQQYNLRVDLGERVERKEILINVENSAQQSAGPEPQQQNSQSFQNSQNSGESQGSSQQQNSQNSQGGNSQSGCPGAPTFSTFTASKSTITLGESVTLNWGGVTNGNSTILVKSVTLSGVGEVGSPGSRSVTPSAAGTSTYTLTATGCGGTATKSVSVTVQKSNSPILATIIQYDLQLTDLYANGAGQVMAKIKNNGPDRAQTSGKLVCTGVATYAPTPGMPPALPVSGSTAFQANLKAGETTEVFSGISRNPTILTLVVTCNIELQGLALGDKANNQVTKQLK